MASLPESSHQQASVSATPVGASERLMSLDVIRGAAVLGILLANIVGFGHPDLAYSWPGALPDGGNSADGIVWLAQFVLVDGKFRGLFSLLFGASMLLFLDKAARHGRGAGLQARRLAWLVIFGLAHFYFLFRGDILFSYAISGFVVLLFLRMSGEKLLALGIIWAVMGALLASLDYLTPTLIEAGSEPGVEGAVAYYDGFWDGQLQEAQLQQILMSGDSYGAILRYHWMIGGSSLVSYFVYCIFETIPLMLIGMGLYRLGVYAKPEEGARFSRLALAGVLAGLALNLALGLFVHARDFPPYLTQFAFFGLSGLTNLPFLLGAPALLSFIAWRASKGWLARHLALAGRMAFTNYIGTSFVMILIFQGWASGLYGQLHRLEMLLAVAFGWALMLLSSRLWLAHFRQGPLEWLWRCLAYDQLFPNRRNQDR